MFASAKDFEFELFSVEFSIKIFKYNFYKIIKKFNILHLPEKSVKLFNKFYNLKQKSIFDVS